jgi:type II secretory pathway component GspD/PulD (secretin)
VIKQLDKPQKQVNIAIKFMETTLKEEEHLGIDWTLRAEAISPFPSDTLPETFDYGALMGDMKGLNAVQLSTPLLSILMKILAADNSAKLLQEPHVTTFNNQTASINVGTTIPILVPQGQGSVFGTNPYTFEDQTVNISLDVTPRINADDYISLKIVASVQAIIGYVGPDADRPSISSRDMNTSVMVKSGGSLLIGGLIFEDNNLSVNKVPILGDLPILKSIFSSTIERTDQRELLVFITPSIVY